MEITQKQKMKKTTEWMDKVMDSIKDEQQMEQNIVCHICKSTYKDILDYKARFIDNIEDLLSIIEEKKQHIQTLKGFKKEKAGFLDNLSKKILNMDLNDFINNKSKLLDEEQGLQVIYNFIKKYDTCNKKVSYITPRKVKDIIWAYRKESENIEELKEINEHLTDLKELKSQVEEYMLKFVEKRKEIIFSKLLKKFKKNYYENIFFTLMFKYLPEQLNKYEYNETIYICPLCNEMLKEYSE